MVWGMIAAVAVTTAISVLKASQKKPTRTQAQPPRMPDSTYGHKLPIVFNKGILGGNLIYTTKPFKVVDVIGGKGGRPKEEREDYEVATVGYLLSFCPKSPVALRRVFLNGEEVYNPQSNDPDLAEKTLEFQTEHLTFYGGFENQVTDPRILALEGASNSLGFVFCSLMILRDIRLSRYGNSYPTVQVVLETDINYTLGSYMREVIEIAEVNSESQLIFGVDVLTVDTILDDVTMDGAVFVPDGNNWENFLRQIMEFYQLVLQESSPGRYVITYPFGQINTDNADIITIDGVNALGVNDQPSYTVTDTTKEEVPNKLTLKFLDEYKDFDENSVTAYASRGKGNNESEVTVPYVFSRQLAANGVERMLRAIQSRKEIIEFQLPITDLGLIELGKIVNVVNEPNLEGRNYIITEFTISGNGFLSLTAEKLNFNIYNHDARASVAEGDTTFTSGNSQAQAVLASAIPDTNLVSQNNTPRQGLYILYDTAGLQATAYLFTSDDDISYNFATTLTSPSPFAFVADTNIVYDSPGLPDYASTLTVTLNNGGLSLSTISDNDFFAGNNLLSWGNELVAFQQANFIGGSTYELTGLLRGFRGTEAFINEVKTENACVIVNDGVFTAPRYDLDFSNAGSTVFFKITTNSSPILAKAPTITVDFENNAAKPYSPFKLSPVYQSSGNIQIQWIPRSINDNNLLITDNGAAEGNIDGATFQIDIRAFGSPTVVRTDTVTNLTTYTYTNGNRTADGLAGSRIDFDVYQVSPITGVGLGYKSL